MSDSHSEELKRAPVDVEAVPTGVKTTHGKGKDVVLVPQPSNDPDDPLV